MTILEIHNLTKSFGGVAAVDGLSMAIEGGRITAIVGPNGSGKTTLVNVLTGAMPLDDGVVMVSGTQLARIKPYEIPVYGITRTFQEVRLFNQMSVLDNLLVVLTERSVFGALVETHREWHLKKAEDLLKKVDLWDKRTALALNLSYGQRKLLEITRALAMDAQLFLFDEPFAGLFPEMAKTVALILKELRAQRRTIVLIEHNMQLIRELADYVFVLDSGRLLAAGEPNEVLAKREVIEAYLGE